VFNELRGVDFADMDSVEFLPDTRKSWKQMVCEETSEHTATDDGNSENVKEQKYRIHIGTQFNNQYIADSWVAGHPHLFLYGAELQGQ